MRRLAWIGWLLVMFTPFAGITAFAGDAPGEPVAHLGTLFYSAQERAALANRRHGNLPGEAALTATSGGMQAGADAATGNIEKAATSYSVSGIVQRERGNSTAWVNGQVVTDGQALTPKIKAVISANGVTVDRHHIRVGETVDIETGLRTDMVSPGAVTAESRK